MTSAARPTITTFGVDGTASKATNVLPTVFLAPIRPDVVHFVHSNIAKNSRQAYATKPFAGHDVSAHSWGTGRAVARIPRVSGGGTSRGGQGAYGNMCRGGHMFGATKIWRRWHRRVNQNQRRYAVCSALAASAVPALVEARGHRITEVPEMPLVLDDAVQKIQKTKNAVKALMAVGAYADCQKAGDSKKIRTGSGKMRNRRYVMRRGPLVVYAQDQGIAQAFRNLPGVDVANVERLNLLQLAPGGHLGRFIVWTESAFKELNNIYGSFNRESTSKKGFRVPRAKMYNSDLTRIINSNEIQEVVRPAVKAVRRSRLKKNPLKNLGAMIKLNPYAGALRRAELLNQEKLSKARKANLAVKRTALLAKKKAALAKTHRVRKGENYKMLTQDEYNGGYVVETEDDPEWIEPEESEEEEDEDAEAEGAAAAKSESGSGSDSD